MHFDSPDPFWDARRRAESRRRILVALTLCAATVTLGAIATLLTGWLS